MAARYYCDLCEDEVETTVAQREFNPFVSHERGGENIGIQIHRSVRGVWNGGHLCNECLRLALTEICAELRQETVKVARS